TGRTRPHTAPAPGAPGAPGQRGVAWVRASDLLTQGAGRVAGLGIDLESALVRHARNVPTSAGRAIRDRTRRLAPLSEFGRAPETPAFNRHGLGRR
ncbi:hypothetical protein, partial [Agromyces seonyuensis]|uniref:hypothetical protein n=1 Tax=Agromyces seonyuensis TaxID=2662446 RepID=UPI001F29C6E8